jgi:exportin-T
MMIDMLQVANAIEIAGNPSSDQALKSQAFDYLNQLRSDPSGWQVCLSLFTKTPQQPEVVRHVSLEVVNSAAQVGLIDQASLALVRDSLLAYIRQTYGPEATATPDAPYIQNKIAQTVTYLFSSLYAGGWESCIDDLLALTNKSAGRDNQLGVVFYLRVLNSIHEEIGDVLVSRSRGEQDKANTLKDLIRERDMQKIANSWQEILAVWREGDDSIVEMCLKAVGSWVSWIDIGLVVNQTMLDLLFQQLGRAEKQELREGEQRVRDAAVDVFTEIIGKKMKPADKIEMIVFLNLDSIITQLSNSPPLRESRFTYKYDTDLAETVAKLVNITVMDIVRVLDNDAGPVKEKAENLLQVFLPHVLRFFSDEYDEVCSTVIPCVSDMLTYIRNLAKANPSFEERNKSILLPILKAIVAKMRYDETSNWGDEDEQTDEAEFQDLRKRLGVLQQIISAADEGLYINAISEVVGTTFENLRTSGGQLDWRDLDLALHEMFLFGDMAVRGGSLYNKGAPTGMAATRLIEMMSAMVENDIRSFTHPATQLQYMEICVRYSSFFVHHSHLIPGVLESFLQLVHHPVRKVKTRSWYLFHRLARQLRSQIGNIAQTVVEALGDLLVIQAEVPSEGDDGDEMSSEDHERSGDVVFTSQLYLFESVGIISSTPSITADKQVLYVQSVLSPVFGDMERNLEAAKNNDQRALLQIHHDIMALGTLAKGFSDWQPGSTGSPSAHVVPEVSAAFAQVAEATLVSLESLKNSFNIRTAARFAFSRLIGVLGAQILPQLPRWIDGLLTQTSSRDEMALFLRLLDQVVFGFKGEIYSILDTLLTPFLQRVFAGIAEPTIGTDDEIQLAELKREYLNFLLAVLGNDLGAVIISERNQSIFETLITTLEHFAKDIEDLTTAKMAFCVLNRMASCWGGPDIGSANGTAPTQAALPGFGSFMINRLSPLTWALPTTPSFNPKDAQAKQVLAEAGGLQRIIYSKTGMEYAEYLRSQELPNMGMGAELIEEFLNALSQLDVKGFRQFFPVCI